MHILYLVNETIISINRLHAATNRSFGVVSQMQICKGIIMAYSETPNMVFYLLVLNVVYI